MEYWLKFYFKFLEWEWYRVGNTKDIFIHLLLKANRRDGKWQGIEVKRSQHVTSLQKLADETGMSIAQVRVALKNLKKTNEITDESHSKFRLITLLKYEHYQGNSKQDDRQVTIKSQRDSNQIATIEEGKNIDIKKYRNKESIDTDENFKMFWSTYPKKIAKQSAYKAWQKLSIEQKHSAIECLPKHLTCDQWQRDGGQFIPHPATWLNNGRWEDDVKAVYKPPDKEKLNCSYCSAPKKRGHEAWCQLLNSKK